MNHVFVYGTLKSGHGNHGYLRGATFVGTGVTTRPFFMCDTGGFPVVFDIEKRHNVTGEVYEVTDEQLRAMDRLEGHPVMFHRTEVVVDVSDTGVQQTCWMYLGTEDYWKRYIPSLDTMKPDTTGAYVWVR